MVQAMGAAVSGPAPEGQEIMKICSGIAMPLWAILILFLPAVIVYWVFDQSPADKKPGRALGPQQPVPSAQQRAGRSIARLAAPQARCFCYIIMSARSTPGLFVTGG